MSDLTWANSTRRLSELVPWEDNPRQIGEADAKRLAESLDQFGQIHAIAIGPGNEIYDGHQRGNVWAACDRYGPEYEVDVRVSSRPLTQAEREMLVVYLHSGATGSWDWEKLSAWDAPVLQGWGLDEGQLREWNDNAANLREMLEASEEEPPEDPGAQVDRAEELREKWDVRLGQMWRLGEHRIICGDCTDAAVVERVMGGEKASLIVTDPPYGVGYEGGANNKVKRAKIAGDDSDRLYDRFLAVAPVGDKCALYMWHAGRRATNVYLAAENNGFEVRSQIIWHKLKAHYGAWMAQYKQKHEPCLYCVKNAPEFVGATNEVTVWEYDQPSRNEHHPTEKPIALFERAIANHPYEIVYDPFVGSGTTIIACERLGRRCRAIEVEPKYVAVTLERVAGLGLEPILLER